MRRWCQKNVLCLVLGNAELSLTIVLMSPTHKHIVVPDEKHRDTSAIQNENMVLQEEYLKDLKRQIERLEVQNEELLHELQESRQREYGACQRADTIILSLTRQFEEQNKLLEDMRQPREAGRSLWSRVKTAFRFAAS